MVGMSILLEIGETLLTDTVIDNDNRELLSRPGIGNRLTRQRVSFGNTHAGLAHMTHTSPHTFLIRFPFLIDSDSCSRLLRSLHIAHVHSSRTPVQESTSIHPRSCPLC